jgi:hypothetical protein
MIDSAAPRLVAVVSSRDVSDDVESTGKQEGTLDGDEGGSGRERETLRYIIIFSLFL